MDRKIAKRRGFAGRGQKQVEVLARGVAVTKAEFGATALERLGAKQFRIAGPAGENLGMFRDAGAVVVFGFIVDLGHRRLLRRGREFAACGARWQVAAALRPSTVCGNLLVEPHESRPQLDAHHLARTGWLVRGRDRSDGAAAPLCHRPSYLARRGRTRHPRHANPRRAIDRRGRGLWNVLGSGRPRVRRRARSRPCDAPRDASDRDQSAMGARRDDGGGAQPAVAVPTSTAASQPALQWVSTFTGSPPSCAPRWPRSAASRCGRSRH